MKEIALQRIKEIEWDNSNGSGPTKEQRKFLLKAVGIALKMATEPYVESYWPVLLKEFEERMSK